MAEDGWANDVELRAELLRRRNVDQQARQRLMLLVDKAVDRVLRVADLAPKDQEIAANLSEVDRENTRWLHEVVQGRGWPTRTLVGDDAAAAAWLLVQHADHDVAFQHRCLDLMRALPEAETFPKYIAYLTDRVLLAEGESQIYGTQVEMVGGEYQPRNLRDPQRVDERRAAVGLGNMAEYRQHMTKH